MMETISDLDKTYTSKLEIYLMFEHITQEEIRKYDGNYLLSDDYKENVVLPELEAFTAMNQAYESLKQRTEEQRSQQWTNT